MLAPAIWQAERAAKCFANLPFNLFQPVVDGAMVVVVVVCVCLYGHTRLPDAYLFTIGYARLARVKEEKKCPGRYIVLGVRRALFIAK